MRYVYIEDVSGSEASLRGLRGCRSCGGFAGASAPYSAAVEKLQRHLAALADAAGSLDYHPGKIDGLYGPDTHAAVIRVTRDYLIPRGSIESTCQSTCNTLWARAESACAECLGRMLASMNNLTIAVAQAVSTSTGGFHGFRGTGDEMEVEFPEEPVEPVEPVEVPPPLTAAEIAEIVGRYRAFLAAYIAEYGDGGQLDPTQIMRREDVDRETAEQLAAERRAEAEAAAAALVKPPSPRKAGFSWWWLLLFAGVGGGMYYAYRRSQQGGADPDEVEEFSDCGCGG